MRKFKMLFRYLILILICISALSTIILFLKNPSLKESQYYQKLIEFPKKIYSESKILCKVLDQYNVPCLKNSNHEVFLSFEFLRKKFDIQGELDKKNTNLFKISFSYSKPFLPKNFDYFSHEYLWFKNINVEIRNRVKYLNLKDGVPVSSQWYKNGHVYPIQVGQFGLSHFSKWINSSKSTIDQKFLVNSDSKFIYHSNDLILLKSMVNGFEFKFPEKAIYVTNYKFDMRYIIAEVSTETNFELVFDLMLRRPALSLVRLVYKFSVDLITEKHDNFTVIENEDKTYNIIYQMNGLEKQKKYKFIRNLCLDACKGLDIKCDNCFNSLDKPEFYINNTLNKEHSFVNQYYKVYQISLKGQGKIENASFREETAPPHLEFALMTGDYFVRTQNLKTGGWPINVTRSFDKNSNLKLNPGWYSAMGQGHAISLLCRIYASSKDEKYFLAAARALNIFDVLVEDGGVKTFFMNTSLIWLEEYPTRPHSLFVLNGFLYSIFGINDFINICLKETNLNSSLIDSYSKIAYRLYFQSMHSLNSLINLFDSGTRTFYDLKHILNPMVNPNVARWDYHSVHVSQLFYLIRIIEQQDKVKINELNSIAKRWLGYSRGLWNKNSQISNRDKKFSIDK